MTDQRQPSSARAAGHVLVVGSINLDNTLTVARPPEAGETTIASAAALSGGGKGANAALAARLSGARTTLIGAVGDDPIADQATADLRAAGVDLRLATLEGRRTGTATILLEPDGQNRIVVHPGANHELRANLTLELAAGLTDIDVVLTNNEVGDDVVEAAAQLAQRHGAQLIVNPAPARPLGPAVVALHPLLTPNEHEVTRLAGIENPARAAAVLHSRTRAAVVVTRGARGISIISDGGLTDVAAPVVAAVDTTGAGDVFNGVLAAGISAGLPLIDAARRAVDWAAHSTLHRGARLMAARAAPDEASCSVGGS